MLVMLYRTRGPTRLDILQTFRYMRARRRSYTRCVPGLRREDFVDRLAHALTGRRVLASDQLAVNDDAFLWVHDSVSTSEG